MEKIKYFTQKELKKLFRNTERQKDFPFVLRDLAMETGGRGARKIVVTDIDLHNEMDATNIRWVAPRKGKKAQVQKIPNMELAFFNHLAIQDRTTIKLRRKFT